MVDETIVADTDVVPDQDIDTPASPTELLETRIARMEQMQQLTQRQVQQLNAAVGRAQSLADKFSKTNDPADADKVRGELANVYEVLGTVADSIDPAILPETAKARVSQAREAARVTAAQADVARQVREAVAAAVPDATSVNSTEYANQIEAQVVAEITGLGLNPDDPAFDWPRAAQMLNGNPAGLPAMLNYIRAQERTLLAGTSSTNDDEPRGPVRRPRAAPPAAGAATTQTTLDRFMDADVSLDDKIKILRENGLTV